MTEELKPTPHQTSLSHVNVRSSVVEFTSTQIPVLSRVFWWVPPQNVVAAFVVPHVVVLVVGFQEKQATETSQ
jgi:hypothetical protein